MDTPICSTSSCQVYRGIPVEPVTGIARWYAAVRRTTGLVLLSEGRPADTVYFSTSNGQTYGNEDVFGSAPLPYLRPVVERDDGASPTSRWQVRIGFGDLATFLSRAGAWPDGRAISAVSGDGSRVTVTDRAGSAHALDGTAFRDAVNTWAPCLQPGRYPSGALPVTIPSQVDDRLVLGRRRVLLRAGLGPRRRDGPVGRLRQGGPAGPRRGSSRYYYGGLRPRRYPEPGLIHVEVASGLTSLRLHASGPGATIDGHGSDRGRS